MDKILIRGGKRLSGTVHISGAKNSALKLMCATLLTDEPVTLQNVPDLTDVRTLSNLLADLGTKITLDGDASASQGPYGQVITFHTPTLAKPHADYELVRQMRASVNTLGPLLGRNGYAEVSLPGGCAIGARPLDLHMMAIEKLGATVTIENGYIIARAPEGGLHGGEIVFPKVTNGGTENALCAAVLAKGETIISNAAREPEIKDLGELLIKMGAKIEGLGTDTIRIQGVEKLHGATHATVSDRIETGTYIIAAAITGGELDIKGGNVEHIRAFVDKVREAGAEIEQTKDGIHVNMPQGKKIKAVDAITEPFPGLATDLQSPLMALMCVSDGASMITETIYENRFMHVPELARMGANITIQGNTAVTRGVQKLNGAKVMATDLRASISLILAGLVAEGETSVSRIYHLDRGYERLEEKFRLIGADIERVSDDSGAADAAE
ncbi:MAG TPA: UDP-N-acetylglucosamine 1-carboxyvinyltransferase [Alphaproteobacteria bacterium]